MCTEFTPDICVQIGNYVYRLIDPRNGETFYVGKGAGNRVFAHIRDELQLREDEDVESAKIQRIREIRSANLAVIHIIHRHGIPDAAVNEVEAALIDAFPGLTNEQGGHGSSSRGPMHSDEIRWKYEAPLLECRPEEGLILFNIPRLPAGATPQQILDQTRFAWPVNVNRARQADYVLAVVKGVVVGVFVADEWLPATAQNFHDLERRRDVPERWGFIGHIADNQVWERFVGDRGRRINNPGMMHGRNPVRYWNIPAQ